MQDGPRRKRPPHLRSLPPRLADTLTPEDSRALADFRLAGQRRQRERDSRGWANGPEGLGALPVFLREIEAAHPRAADLWLNLRPGSTRADLDTLGARLGLSPVATGAALDALRLAELVGFDSSGRFTSLSPASVPF